MIWAARLDELLWACGWTLAAAAVKFSCHPATVARVLKGGAPKVAFILRLKELEAAYAGEIEALRSGAIHKAGKRRTCRDDFRRPENLSPLGAGSAMGENIRFGFGDREAVAPRVMFLSPEIRARLAAYKAPRPRRPKAVGGGA